MRAFTHGPFRQTRPWWIIAIIVLFAFVHRGELAETH
jgi:hypothetical protein